MVANPSGYKGDQRYCAEHPTGTGMCTNDEHNIKRPPPKVELCGSHFLYLVATLDFCVCLKFFFLIVFPINVVNL